MNILIVEDDVFFQKFYSQKLQEAGFTVNIAPDGDVAIDIAREVKPDLIILDIIMPKKDGFEVLEDISKDQELSKIPILVFSTLGQDEDVQRAIKLGAVGYINKTFFDFGNLKGKIEAAIKAKKT
jgi:DNA-binding response OmpR family regulator